MKLVPLPTVLLFDRNVLFHSSPKDKIASITSIHKSWLSEMIVSPLRAIGRKKKSLCAFLVPDSGYKFVD